MCAVKVCLIFLMVWICRASAQNRIVADDCECVPFYLCINGTINTNGEGIIDIRLKPDECPSYLDVCCKKNNTVDTPITEAPLPVKIGCGYRNPDGVGYRITGGSNNEAQFGEFPWMIAVFRKGTSDTKHLYKCGGSLIHPQVVLTAAHCVIDGGSFMIRAGEWDTQTTREIFKHQDVNVASVVVHPDFLRKNLHNNVALLFLESPVDTSKASHIREICLPPQNSVVLSDECFVNGWGKDRFDKTELYQVILKKVQVPVVDRDQCQKNFRKTRLGSLFDLNRSFMCAGGEEGKDACTGDGGGPLVCPISGEDERYQQVGIVAWGIGCGVKDIPGAYVDVAYFRKWIDQQMNKKNLVVDSYNFK